MVDIHRILFDSSRMYAPPILLSVMRSINYNAANYAFFRTHNILYLLQSITCAIINV